jgi:hypothetical protein
MKHKREVTILTMLIALLALFAAICGVIPGEGAPHEFRSLHGQAVAIYGSGLYRSDSVTVAAQAAGQDIVTIFFGVPFLLLSLYLARKGLFKGRLLLTGALGYFLYTYASYSFLSMYNELFLIDVALMSMSFFAFTLSMMSFDMETVRPHFSEKLRVKAVGGLLIFIASALGLLWLKLIVPPLLSGTIPSELEHYTTLVIQALDLGFVVPVSVLSGILLIKRKPFGYLLSAVMIVKETALLAAITAMMIAQAAAGVAVGGVVIAAFSVFDLAAVACLILIVRNVREKTDA